MTKKLFVGNLPFQVRDMELEELFGEYGEVSSAKVIVDRRTGRSKGFGFVEMKAEESANKAVEALNGYEFKGRPINVSFAREQTNNERRSDSGFSDRSYGGYNEGRSNLDNY